MAIKIMYTIFLGLLVALFVGLGIAAFYPAPKAPESPAILNEPPSAPVPTDKVTITETAEQRAARLKFDQDQKTYQKQFAVYNRQVSIISMIAAVIVLVAALSAVNKIQLISDGLLLGGILTLLYSIVRGFMGEDNLYRFIVVTIGLIIALVIGYIKFIQPEKGKSSSS